MASDRYTPIWNGLWSQKHHKKLGPAWMLFGFLLSKCNKGGLVRITYREIVAETGSPERTIQFWMAILKREAYVTVQKSDGMVIQIRKFRALNTAKACAKTPQGVAGPENEIPQDVAGLSRNILRHRPQDLAASKSTNDQKQKGSPDSLNLINKSINKTESLSNSKDLKSTSGGKEKNKSEVHQAIAHFQVEYLRIHGIKPEVNGAACKTFQRLLGSRPLSQVNKLTTSYLLLGDDTLREKGYPVEWLPGNINRLLLAEVNSASRGKVVL